MSTPPAPSTVTGPIVFVSHSAERTGAPIVLLHLLRWLKANTSLDVRLVLANGGPLETDYAALVPTQVLGNAGIAKSGKVKSLGSIPILGPLLRNAWHRFRSRTAVATPPALIYANTIATVAAVRMLARPGTPVITHVHELEGAIQANAGKAGMDFFRSVTTHYVVASQAVAQNLTSNHRIAPSAMTIVPSFVAVKALPPGGVARARADMRAKLNIPPDAFVVAGCGAFCDRKGTDLFLDVARHVKAIFPARQFHFVWVGKTDRTDPYVTDLLAKASADGLDDILRFPGEVPDASPYFAGADAFALTSREEPFGIVALEAALFDAPALCFADVGGLPEFIESDAGYVVPHLDAAAMAIKLCDLMSDPDLCLRLGRRAHQKTLQRHDVGAVGPLLLGCIEQALATANRR